MKKFKKRKGLYGVIVCKDNDGYRVVSADYYAHANAIKQDAQLLANWYNHVYIPLFFRNYYQAQYYHVEDVSAIVDTLPDRHRGREYKSII